ncbi:hypothetical protein PR048_005480 [Dryococelus australis]|uniref:Uncharacterized protein n=1 Tax=Dryococelus australis TaxID=614101 RepID=A0ABQ9I9D2_9NEOP|nr:hypothetical protein PR048_005480 [Dryococelus australis]
MFTPDRIFNTDETVVTTVHNPRQAIFPNGLKQVGSMTSFEWGTSITIYSSSNSYTHFSSTHNLQPLDSTIFGPFKKYYNSASFEWMLTNWVNLLKIYDVAK